jgi:hypothetical protein
MTGEPDGLNDYGFRAQSLRAAWAAAETPAEYARMRRLLARVLDDLGAHISSVSKAYLFAGE